MQNTQHLTWRKKASIDTEHSCITWRNDVNGAEVFSSGGETFGGKNFGYFKNFRRSSGAPRKKNSKRFAKVKRKIFELVSIQERRYFNLQVKQNYFRFWLIKEISNCKGKYRNFGEKIVNYNSWKKKISKIRLPNGSGKTSYFPFTKCGFWKNRRKFSNFDLRKEKNFKFRCAK